MLISFAWTRGPFLADIKTVTRRHWRNSYAHKFQEGMIVDAYDKLPYRGGVIIGQIRLTKQPYLQRTGLMTEEDYVREGLQWMEDNKKKVKGEHPRKFFDDWKKKDDLVWVVEFEKAYDKGKLEDWM